MPISTMVCNFSILISQICSTRWYLWIGCQKIWVHL